jgi:hypothetical protein
MLITIDELNRWFREDPAGVVGRVQEETGRYGSEEARAWQRSIRIMLQVFRAPSFQPLHLYFERRGHLALEYQLPASSSWADVVMLGCHGPQQSAVVIELKDWTTAADRAGKAEGLIERMGRQELHPSDQVRGYTEYCRRFHSAVDDNTIVNGCVLFTHQAYTHEYTSPPNDALTRNYPIFTTAAEDVDKKCPAFFGSRLTETDPDFAYRFATGKYRQQRGFVAQIGAQILNPTSSTFELLDDQRRAFALCKTTVEEAFLSRRSIVPQKRVVIVKGPPGSGKSVIAAKLWATLVTDSRLPEGDVVFVTTSLSQNSNWSYIFDQVAEEGGHALVRKATMFTPLTPNALGRLRQKHGHEFMSDHHHWRDNLRLLRNLGDGFHEGSRDDQNLVSIVDEAHGLINPEHTAGRGNFGFATSLGPQAFHIIRTSQLTVFLLDPLQGFRERENTTIDDLLNWSNELGTTVEVVSLEGAQFRCGGSAEYTTWLEALLRGAPAATNQVLASAWRVPAPAADLENVIDFVKAQEAHRSTRVAEKPLARSAIRRSQTGGFHFEIVQHPLVLEERLREHVTKGNSVRLLSSYSREWRTADAAAPHHLPASMQDFCETYLENEEQRTWSRVWNYIPQGGRDYTAFVRAAAGSRMAEDPLCEVGCPFAVRGFDYDYVGILWLNDLLWRGDHWTVELDAVHERGINNLVRRARKERPDVGPATADVLQRTLQAYRILLTRALRGIYLWIPDDETRIQVLASLGD